MESKFKEEACHDKKGIGFLYILKALLNYSSEEEPLKLWGSNIEPDGGTLGSYLRNGFSETIGRTTLRRKLDELEDFLNNVKPDDESKGLLCMRIKYNENGVYITHPFTAAELAYLNVLVTASSLSVDEKDHMIVVLRKMARWKNSDYGDDIEEFKAEKENGRGTTKDRIRIQTSEIEFINSAIRRKWGLDVLSSKIQLGTFHEFSVPGSGAFFPFYYKTSGRRTFIIGAALRSSVAPEEESDSIIKLVAFDLEDIDRLTYIDYESGTYKDLYNKCKRVIDKFPLDDYLKANPILSTGYLDKPEKDIEASVRMITCGNVRVIDEIEGFFGRKFENKRYDILTHTTLASVRAPKEIIAKAAMAYPGIFIVEGPSGLVKYIKQRIDFVSKAYLSPKGGMDYNSFSADFREETGVGPDEEGWR